MKRKIHKQGSTAMFMRICGDRFKPCYDNQTGEKLKYLEVTQDIFKLGILFVVEEDAPVDNEGMAEVTFLDYGNFIVITDKGFRCLKPDIFHENYNF